MKRFRAVTSSVALATLSVSASAWAQSAACAGAQDIEVVLSAIKDKTTTAFQKSQLQAKCYTGSVTVTDVENMGTNAKPAVRLVVQVRAADYSYSFMMSFATTDVAKAGLLRKGSTVKVTGRLSSIWKKPSGYMNVPATEWADFIDVTIDAIIPEGRGV